MLAVPVPVPVALEIEPVPVAEYPDAGELNGPWREAVPVPFVDVPVPRVAVTVPNTEYPLAGEENGPRLVPVAPVDLKVALPEPLKDPVLDEAGNPELGEENGPRPLDAGKPALGEADRDWTFPEVADLEGTFPDDPAGRELGDMGAGRPDEVTLL